MFWLCLICWLCPPVCLCVVFVLFAGCVHQSVCFGSVLFASCVHQSVCFGSVLFAGCVHQSVCFGSVLFASCVQQPAAVFARCLCWHGPTAFLSVFSLLFAGCVFQEPAPVFALCSLLALSTFLCLILLSYLLAVTSD